MEMKENDAIDQVLIELNAVGPGFDSSPSKADGIVEAETTDRRVIRFETTYTVEKQVDEKWVWTLRINYQQNENQEWAKQLIQQLEGTIFDSMHKSRTIGDCISIQTKEALFAAAANSTNR